HPSHGERIGARHDDKLLIGARVDRRFDAIHHFPLGDDFLARTMAATLRLDLILDVQAACAELGERPHGARNVECPAPAGVRVHQQRQRTDIGNAANVDEHIVHGADPEIRDPQGIGRDTAAGEIEGPEAAGGRHARGVCVDGADHLQGVLSGDRGAEARTGGTWSACHTRPATGMSAPVTALASLDTKKAMTSAASLNVTQRLKSAFGISSRFFGVSSVLGKMALTVMPRSLSSSANASVNRATPALEA